MVRRDWSEDCDVDQCVCASNTQQISSRASFQQQREVKGHRDARNMLTCYACYSCSVVITYLNASHLLNTKYLVCILLNV